MTSKILELPQSEANTVYSNGDYSISLPYKRDLTISENDVIQLKNIFIDTESQSNNKINISKAITATLEIGYYYTYSRQDNLTTFGTGGSLPAVDGKPYILAIDPRQTDPSGNYEALIKIGVSGTYNDPWAGGNITVNYTDENGNPASRKVYVKGSPDRHSGSSATCYIVGKTGSFSFSGGDSDTRINPHYITVDADPTLKPVISKITLTIPVGTYTPNQLVVELNRQTQLACKGGVENPEYTNKVFQRVEDLVPTPTSGSQDPYLVNLDGTNVVKVSDRTLLVGASQFEFAFDGDTNQFSFNYIHTPYYDSGSTPAQPAVGFLKTSTTPLEVISLNKNAGIYIESATSTYPDGSDANFWIEFLGFNLTSLITAPEQTPKVTINTADVTPFKLNPPLNDGQNITGGFMALGTQQDLTGADWWKSPNFSTLTAPFLSTTQDTLNILGTQQDISNNVDFGYYLVSIDANFKSDYYSKNEKGNIMGVVSRYYELNSFTSGTSDDSLVYVHKGEPMTLSDFRVRIMSPSKEVAVNLGTNTAVFLEIIKGEQ